MNTFSTKIDPLYTMSNSLLGSTGGLTTAVGSGTSTGSFWPSEERPTAQSASYEVREAVMTTLNTLLMAFENGRAEVRSVVNQFTQDHSKAENYRLLNILVNVINSFSELEEDEAETITREHAKVNDKIVWAARCMKVDEEGFKVYTKESLDALHNRLEIIQKCFTQLKSENKGDQEIGMQLLLNL